MAALVTVEEVAALLPIRAGNTSQDAKLALLIGSASAMIEQVIGRELAKADRVELYRSPNTFRSYYDLSGFDNESGSYVDARSVRYVLKSFPVDTAETFEIRYDPTREFAASTVVEDTNYTLDATTGVVMLKLAMIEAADSVQITYTGGHEVGSEGDLSASIPVELKMACLSQVLHMFTKFTADNVGKDSDTTQGKAGGNRFSVKSGLVPEAMALISRYKMVGIGIY